MSFSKINSPPIKESSSSLHTRESYYEEVKNSIIENSADDVMASDQKILEPEQVQVDF